MDPLSVTSLQKRTMLVLCAALSMSIFIYGGLVFMMASTRHVSGASLPSMRPVLYGVALAALMGSALWTVTQLSSSRSAAIFQSRMIIGIALAEACSIVGLLLFFLGAPPFEFLYFALGSLLVIGMLIIPRVLALPVKER